MANCINCRKELSDEQIRKSEPVCSQQCLDQAIEFSFLAKRLDWQTALQLWAYHAELRGNIINEI